MGSPPERLALRGDVIEEETDLLVARPLPLIDMLGSWGEVEIECLMFKTIFFYQVKVSETGNWGTVHCELAPWTPSPKLKHPGLKLVNPAKPSEPCRHSNGREEVEKESSTPSIPPCIVFRRQRDFIGIVLLRARIVRIKWNQVESR